MKINLKRGASLITIYLMLILIFTIGMVFAFNAKVDNNVEEIQEVDYLQSTDYEIEILEMRDCNGLDFGLRRVYLNEGEYYLQMFVTNNTGKFLTHEDSIYLVDLLDENKEKITTLGIAIGDADVDQSVISQTSTTEDILQTKYLIIRK